MKTKVIFLIGTLSDGGAERVVSNLSMNLSEDFDKEIILFGRDAKIEYEYKGRITYLDQDHPTNPLTKMITLLKRVRVLSKIKSKNNNVPIISFLEYPNLLNILSGHNRSSIVSVRNFMSTKHEKGFKAAFWNFTIKRLYKRARKIIVVSKQMRADLIKNYNLSEEKIKVIYNSYPIKEIKKLAIEELNDIENTIFLKPTIITVGRLNKQKGQIHLINAFTKVKETIPHAQLVFLGEGSLEKELRDQARNLKIESDVHFFGFKKNPFKYIANSKVFVMTSYYEGFPNALAEAMACKVPVISTDCPSGPREIIAPREDIRTKNNENVNKYGFLVPAFKKDNEKYVESKIANITIQLSTNKEKNKIYSDKSFRRIQHFNISFIIKQWEKIINDNSI